MTAGVSSNSPSFAAVSGVARYCRFCPTKLTWAGRDVDEALTMRQTRFSIGVHGIGHTQRRPRAGGDTARDLHDERGGDAFADLPSFAPGSRQTTSLLFLEWKAEALYRG